MCVCVCACVHACLYATSMHGLWAFSAILADIYNFEEKKLKEMEKDRD